VALTVSVDMIRHGTNVAWSLAPYHGPGHTSILHSARPVWPDARSDSENVALFVLVLDSEGGHGVGLLYPNLHMVRVGGLTLGRRSSASLGSTTFALESLDT